MTFCSGSDRVHRFHPASPAEAGFAGQDRSSFRLFLSLEHATWNIASGPLPRWIGVGMAWLAPPLPPNRTGGFPASGSPVSGSHF